MLGVLSSAKEGLYSTFAKSGVNIESFTTPGLYLCQLTGTRPTFLGGNPDYLWVENIRQSASNTLQRITYLDGSKMFVRILKNGTPQTCYIYTGTVAG